MALVTIKAKKKKIKITKKETALEFKGSCIVMQVSTSDPLEIF